MIGFDPVRAFLDDSELRCGNSVLFFHDKYGGSCVAVAIKPESLRGHFDVEEGADDKVLQLQKDSHPVPSKDSILEELATISGDGLVESLVKDPFSSKKDKKLSKLSKRDF